jgi:hypothetical protein
MDRPLAAELLVNLHENGVPVEVLADAVTAKVVIDIGNSETYALMEIGETTRLIRFPSIKSVRGANAQMVMENRGSPGKWNVFGNDEHVVTVDGLDTFVGNLALRASRYPENVSGSETRYFDGWNLDFLFAAVGALTPGAERINAQVITFIPFSLWGNAYQKAIASLKKSHTFNYNGKTKKLSVTSVTVEREGHAAWYSLDRVEGDTLILDWGGGTCNIVLVNQHGDVVNGATVPVGVETIMEDVSIQLPRALNFNERTQLLAHLKDGKDFNLTINGKSESVSKLASKIFQRAALNFRQKLYAMIPVDVRARLARITMVGGAPYFIKKEDIDIASLVIPSNPELRNLYGAAMKNGITLRKKK